MQTFQKLQPHQVLQVHHQRPGDYCSVSALEFVSKMYGLIPLDQHPLQSNPQNEKKGFGDKVLQNLVHLDGEDKLHDIQSALGIIETEMNQDRCLIISLATFLTPDGTNYIQSSYHIYVLVSEDGQPTLIDPATQRSVGKGIEYLTKALEWNSQMNQERKEIHIQTIHPKT